MTDVIARSQKPLEGRIQVRRLVPADQDEVLALLARCSPRTLLHRFHGVTDGTSYARQLATRADHETLCAWDGLRCIAMASLASGPTDHELGVLVEDAWQRHGIGTSLLVRLVSWARSQGISQLGADVLGEDAFAVRLLARLGPIESTLDWGVYRLRITLNDVPSRRRDSRTPR